MSDSVSTLRFRGSNFSILDRYPRLSTKSRMGSGHHKNPNPNPYPNPKPNP